MPTSSIIIPVYNRASLTRQCLNAVLDCPCRFGRPEIIVVDDASTDITPKLLAEYEGAVTTIRLPENHGFATSCNTGAAAASGDYLVFLNNDTLPQPGWLDALMQYAEDHPAAAVVGSKLLYLNDTIQHAGVAICQDHYPRHIYSGFPANHPAVNKSRRYRIVTAACVLFRRAPFFEAGGFDTHFLNDCEDVDLCLRLGELGYEVHYCHESVAYHFESATRAQTGEYIGRGLELYSQRWLARVEPDDVRYYLEDGLLKFTYAALYPVSVQVSPYLATGQAAEPDLALERLLNYRTAQVGQLLRVVAARASAGLMLKVTEKPAGPAPSSLTARTLFSKIEAPPDAHDQADLMHPDVESLVGYGDPWVIGQIYLGYFVEAAGLKPHERVLDVGCGVGRMALPLARYLSSAGSYDGFDINAEFVAWCREKIAARYPNFHFHHADIFNPAYNLSGRWQASQYRFPFTDRSFDFVVAMSLFTHMLPDGVENYLAEIVRVLRPGGRCLISLLLLDEENTRLVDEGRAMFTLPNRHGTYRTESKEIPEGVVSYDLDYLRGLLREHGLTLSEPVRFGNWSGRQHEVIEGQDFLVAVKGVVDDGESAGVPVLDKSDAYPLESASLMTMVSSDRAAAHVLFEGTSHVLPGGPGHTRISLLMPIKNGAATLEKVLGAVVRQRFPAELEIIAVDSGSTDESIAILKAFQATVIAIDPASFDHGMTRNLLASYARGQVLIFLNQLARPANEHWLARLVEPLEANPLLAGVSSRLIPWPNADPLVYRDVVEQPNGSPDRAILSTSSWTEYQRLDPEARRLRLNFTSVSAAIRPEVLARFPFRPVRLIAEDIQWAKDVLTAGYQLQYEPESMVYHSHDYTLAEMLQRHVDDGAANHDIVGRRVQAAQIGPAVVAQFEADRSYLKEALHLAGDTLDTWQLEAFVRRTVQIMGQWVGSNYDDFDPALLRALSRVEHIRRGLSPAGLPAAVEHWRPFPPPELLFRVIASTDANVFEQSGHDNAEDFAGALATQGRQLADFGAILDFGCGPGRILRHLAERVPVERLSASDPDSDAVRWVRTHYPLVDARTNGPLPPLSFAAGTFDLVISYSVFTHLDEPYQDAWLEELKRVTASGAWLLLTVHGNANWTTVAARLPGLQTGYDAMDEELRRVGFLHWRGDGWEEHFPDYYHTTWHTLDYIQRHWSRWFTVMAILEAQARPNQDIIILRRE